MQDQPSGLTILSAGLIQVADFKRQPLPPIYYCHLFLKSHQQNQLRNFAREDSSEAMIRDHRPEAHSGAMPLPSAQGRDPGRKKDSAPPTPHLAVPQMLSHGGQQGDSSNSLCRLHASWQNATSASQSTLPTDPLHTSCWPLAGPSMYSAKGCCGCPPAHPTSPTLYHGKALR